MRPFARSHCSHICSRYFCCRSSSLSRRSRSSLACLSRSLMWSVVLSVMLSVSVSGTSYRTSGTLPAVLGMGRGTPSEKTPLQRPFLVMHHDEPIETDTHEHRSYNQRVCL